MLQRERGREWEGRDRVEGGRMEREREREREPSRHGQSNMRGLSTQILANVYKYRYVDAHLLESIFSLCFV